MRMLVIGGSGLVGSNIVRIGKENGLDVRATYLSTETEHTQIELDKTDQECTIDVVGDVEPDVIVDTAAFHAVDDCESERDTAWSVNPGGTRNVAVAANKVDAQLVYLSTDYVFPGNPDETPYRESDPVSPLNYYAETKYAAEQATKIANSSTILRPSVIYGQSSSNFATWVLGELEDRNEINIVDDQTSAPTFAPDLAKACIEIAENEITGLYHTTGPTPVSRYEFTRTLAEVFGYDKDLVTPISTEELGQEAPRPTDSTLNSSALYEAIGYEFRSPEEAFLKMNDK